MKEKNNFKIIFIDLDGTLLNTNQEVSKYSREVIQRLTKTGIYVILCSGRATIDTVRLSKIANASPIVISDNGAIIYDYKEDRKIYQSEIDIEAIRKISEIAKKNNIGVALNSIHTRYKNKNSNKDAILINDICEIKENISELVVNSSDYDSIINFKDIIARDFNCIEARNFWNSSRDEKNPMYEMDILNKSNDKGNAVKFLLNYLNIKKEEAICIGDQINDFTMFQNCKVKVAMCNGNDELKALADYITEYANYEDGVAKFLAKFI